MLYTTMSYLMRSTSRKEENSEYNNISLMIWVSENSAKLFPEKEYKQTT